ncbi:MAG: hypothetical protein V3V16_00500 [Melioribacteraceae bacterium]
MSDFIATPLSHPEWNPTHGDYYSASIVADDEFHERKINRRNYLIGSLISVHIVLLVSVVIFFS